MDVRSLSDMAAAPLVHDLLSCASFYRRRTNTTRIGHARARVTKPSFDASAGHLRGVRSIGPDRAAPHYDYLPGCAYAQRWTITMSIDRGEAHPFKSLHSML